MSSDLVFNIKNVFSEDKRYGVLGQYSASKYYIPPYQRGYKWKSKGPDAWVKILMEDISEAFRDNEEEYYLQYITFKKNEINNEKILELIDGQQRITTLFILFNIISSKIDSSNDLNNKLLYGVRENVQNFLDIYISKNITTILESSWEEFIDENPGFDEQDIYYIFHAAQRINKELPVEEKLPEFRDYINKHIKLIINSVSSSINSEKIFSNINSNKVELTDNELVKALFLTRIVRENDANQHNYRELMEKRALMGRQWDEISRWVNREDIKTFYFSKNDAMESFLTILALQNDDYEEDTINEKYKLFNFFQSKVKNTKEGSINYYNNLKLLFKVLNNWYNDNEIYNRLGFLFFVEDGWDISEIVKYIKGSKEEFKSILLEESINQIPDPEEIYSLEYENDHPEIRKILLALNVLLYDKTYRFNFYKLDKENWSLEHIFPQNPDKLPKELAEKDIELIKELLPQKEQFDFSKYQEDIDIEELYNNIIEKLNKTSCYLGDEEKELLYNLIRVNDLDNIGNIALLTDIDNRSNSNGMFDYKRKNIAEKVSYGSFVPKHTYDVFSKIFTDDINPNLTVWNSDDINAHREWIIEKIKKIKDKI